MSNCHFFHMTEEYTEQLFGDTQYAFIQLPMIVKPLTDIDIVNALFACDLLTTKYG